MSEYQYYEWQTLHRPLTSREREEVEYLSSHITVTSVGAWVDYSWSDFKHDPLEVLASYFDAFLYMANWGSRRLAFRFPKHLIEPEAFEPYLLRWNVELKPHGDFYILDLYLVEAEIYEWVEGEGLLGRLSQLYNDIIDGDMRALYIAWLAAQQHEVLDDEAPEPPVPPGLKQLTPALATLTKFFDVDDYLLSAAAAASPDLQASSTSDRQLQAAISQLSREECEAFLQRLLANEPHLTRTLKRRLQELTGAQPAQTASPGGRTFDDLEIAAEALEKEETERERREAEARRRAYLLSLAPQQDAIWASIEELIERKHARAYDQATSKLIDLRDLAALQGTEDDFQRRLDDIHQRYARRHAFIKRLQKAGLEPS